MKKSAILSALALACGLAFATSASAATPNGGADAFAKAKAAAGTAGFTTKAKVALYYTPTFGGIIRSKGVAAVTNPSTGIICVTPSVALNLAGVFPQVTIDWNLSSGFSLLAYTKDTNAFSDCPAGDLEVTTYTFDATGAVLSNLVAIDLQIL